MAIELAAVGAGVALADTSEQGSIEVAEVIRQNGGAAEFVNTDVPTAGDALERPFFGSAPDTRQLSGGLQLIGRVAVDWVRRGVRTIGRCLSGANCFRSF